MMWMYFFEILRIISMIGGVLMIIVGFMIRRYVIKKLRDYKEDHIFGQEKSRDDREADKKVSEKKISEKKISEKKLRVTESQIEVHTDTLV